MAEAGPRRTPSASVPFLPEAVDWIRGAALPSCVAVAWSGGADSTALLLALCSQGHQVEAWHVDHGWRPGSESESEALARRAAAWGIPFRSARNPAASSGNREAEARDFRYRQFMAWAETGDVSALCLAHHREDQAETVCLRMLQGSGMHGIRGMAAAREIGGLTLFRPLLHVPRDALRQALRRAGVSWFEDPSNRDLSLWRNRIRHRLFPAMHAVGTDPWRLFLRWGEQAGRLAAIIDTQLTAVALAHVDGSVSVTWHDWSALLPPARARMLQRMTRILFGEGVVPGRRHILMVETWTARNGSGGLDLSRCRLVRRRGRLYLEPVAERHGNHDLIGDSSNFHAS
jgi:tRNA(Ile)-lysidine synthase